MKYPRKPFGALTAAASLLVAGCATSSAPAIQGIAAERAPVVIVKERSFVNCPKFSKEKTFSILSSPRNWSEHRRSAVLVPNDLSQWNPDFSRSTVVMLSLGQAQTQGWRVHSGNGIKRVGDELVVPVVIDKPAKGASVGSAQGNPCMYLQVTGADYKLISVIEQKTGQVMFKSAL